MYQGGNTVFLPVAKLQKYTGFGKVMFDCLMDTLFEKQVLHLNSVFISVVQGQSASLNMQQSCLDLHTNIHSIIQYVQNLYSLVTLFLE